MTAGRPDAACAAATGIVLSAWAVNTAACNAVARMNTVSAGGAVVRGGR